VHHQRFCTFIRRYLFSGIAVAIETRPVLADIPLPGLRLLGGEQGPQEDNDSYPHEADIRE
jgi:hypothetical protein